MLVRVGRGTHDGNAGRATTHAVGTATPSASCAHIPAAAWARSLRKQIRERHANDPTPRREGGQGDVLLVLAMTVPGLAPSGTTVDPEYVERSRGPRGDSFRLDDFAGIDHTSGSMPSGRTPAGRPDLWKLT